MYSRDRLWLQTDRVWRQFAQMDQVMERLDADLLAAARKAKGAAMNHARDICLGCPWDEECRRWLARNDGPSSLAGFCANAAFFEACRRTGPAARRAGS